MRELIEYIVKNLVTNPEGVEVSEERNNGEVNLTLTVDPQDMGIVIGKSGQTIKAVRRLITVRAIAENVKVNLRLNEVEGGKESDESKESKEEDSGVAGTDESVVPQNDESGTEADNKAEKE